MDNYGQNQQQDQYYYDGNNVTPQYPQVNPHSGQYAFTMNPSLQQQSHQYQSSYSQQQSYQKKPIGLSIFNVPIFTHFNPKAAIVILLVNGKTGDLIIQMAPAIPNNPAIGLKGPVPAGTKVYDYEKEVMSSFAVNEVYDLLTLLQNKFTNNKQSTFTTVINNTNATITSIKDYMSSMFSQQFYTNIQSIGTIAKIV